MWQGFPGQSPVDVHCVPTIAMNFVYQSTSSSAPYFFINNNHGVIDPTPIVSTIEQVKLGTLLFPPTLSW